MLGELFDSACFARSPPGATRCGRAISIAWGTRQVFINTSIFPDPAKLSFSLFFFLAYPSICNAPLLDRAQHHTTSRAASRTASIHHLIGTLHRLIPASRILSLVTPSLRCCIKIKDVAVSAPVHRCIPVTMSSDIKVTRASPGTHKFTKRELTHINRNDYSRLNSSPSSCHVNCLCPETDFHGLDLTSGLRHHVGGLEIQNNSWNASIKVAVPSRLAESLERNLSNLNNRGAGGDTRHDRVKWARRDILSKFDDDSVLLDMTSDDEEDLNAIMRTEHPTSVCYLLMRNPIALPKVYTDWSPMNTEIALYGDGLRLVFKDSSNRALIKVVVGDSDESTFKPSSTTVAAPRPQRTPTPVTPMKRKTADPRHQERASAQSDSSVNPFKQARVDPEMPIDAKRAPSAQNASTSIVDTKIYGKTDSHLIHIAEFLSLY